MPVRFDSPWVRVGTMLAWGAAMLTMGHLPGSAWILGWLAFFAWTSIQSRIMKRTRLLDVRAGADGVHVGKLTIAKKDILTATPIHDRGRYFVRLMRSWNRRIDVEVSSEEEAASLLRELGLDAEASAASFPVMPARASRGPWALLPFALVAFFWMGGATVIGSSNYPIGVFVIAMLFLARKRLSQVSLVVGTDGIQITSLMKSVFYKHSAVSRVEQEDAKVIITLKSGEVLEYKTANQRKPKLEELELARRICERIQAARSAVHPTEDAATTALDRAGRSPREWLEFLRRVGDGAESTFRKAAVSRESLLRTLENPEASGLDRLAALVSLARNLSVEEAPRVRVAIDACAEQKLASRLRVALEDPSPAALEQALIEAEAEAESSPSDSTNARER